MIDNEDTRCFLREIISPAPYVEGEIDDVMRELAGLFTARGYKLVVKVGKSEFEVTNPEVIFNALDFHEKTKGVGDLVKLLMKGVVVEASIDEAVHCRIEAKLDRPRSDDDNKIFIGMIEEWFSDNDLPYMNRFYRRPTLAQDPVDRYLDNPLESCFKLIFGFALQYRVSVSCLMSSGFDEDLKNNLVKVMDRQ